MAMLWRIAALNFMRRVGQRRDPPAAMDVLREDLAKAPFHPRRLERIS
jgi:hypothetical protein